MTDLRAIGERLQRQYPAECAETLPTVRRCCWRRWLRVIVRRFGCSWVPSGFCSRSPAPTSAVWLWRAPLAARRSSPSGGAGSTRGRLLRQGWWKIFCSSPSAELFGVFLAFWSIDSMKALVPSGTRFQNLSVNFNVLLFSAGASLGTGLFFGLWPALRAARTDLREVPPRERAGARSVLLRNGRARSWWHLRWRLTVLLVSGAGYLLAQPGEDAKIPVRLWKFA